jgi:hypothetical protein
VRSRALGVGWGWAAWRVAKRRGKETTCTAAEVVGIVVREGVENDKHASVKDEVESLAGADAGSQLEGGRA